MDYKFKNATVKWFNSEKGYGFIVNENGEDIFVHYSVIDTDGYKYLEEGQSVNYEFIETDKGLQAINVKPIKGKDSIKS